VFLSFAAKDHDLEGPHSGPDYLFLPHFRGIKSGKGVALRKEKGLFYILFVAAWTKRMASGGTRPAGSALILKVKNNRLTIYCSSDVVCPVTIVIDTSLNFVKTSRGTSI
jgi:hypothetical protein